MTHCATHVFARVAGYGLVVTPYAPYRLRCGPCGDNVLEVEHGTRYARITAGKGGYTGRIAEGTGSLFEVVDIQAGPDAADWMIETTGYRCLLPKDYWLCSTSSTVSLFDLFGPRDELLYFQSPHRLPPVSELVAPGQKVEDAGVDGDVGWIELSYSHDGVAYRQRHDVLARQPGNLALTVQAPAAAFESARETGVMVAGSLEYTRV